MSVLQQISLYAMSFFYIAAGINHFINPVFYIRIMPSFFPAPALLNQLSGVAEVILGVGILFAATRQWSAYLIIAMLISFFLVHIPHLIYPPDFAKGKYWILILRIPLQFVFIYWAWKVSTY